MGTFSHAACYSYVRGIQNYHMDAKGWSDVAYNAIVCPHGYTFECRWLGRQGGANGTTTGNRTAYAICYLGGQGDPFTLDADRAIHDTTTHMRRHGSAGPKVNCHRDWKATACPGDVICTRVRAGVYQTDAGSMPAPQPDVPDIKELEPMDTSNIRIARGDVDGHWYVCDGIYKKHVDGKPYAGVLISNFGAIPQSGSGDPAKLNEIVPWTWAQEIIDNMILIGDPPG